MSAPHSQFEQGSTVIDMNMNSEEPLVCKKFVHPSGVTVVACKCDILLSEAKAIATSEHTTLTGGGEVSRLLLLKQPEQYKYARERMKKHYADFEYGKVYPCFLTPAEVEASQSKFDTVYHAIVPNARMFFGWFPSIDVVTGKWDKYMRQAYRELLQNADTHGSASLALPLFGCGKAGASFQMAIYPLLSCLEDLSSLGRNFPKSLRTIAIYTIKEDAYKLLTERLHQCFGSPQLVLPVEASEAVTESVLNTSNHEFAASPVVPDTTHSIIGSYEEALMRNGVDRVYKMESRIRGIALIISNELFQYPEFTNRAGTCMDCSILLTLFQYKLHFEVRVFKDLTAQEMRAVLDTFSKDPKLSHVDSMMVAVLTHGGHGDFMYGVDARRGDDGRPVPGTYIEATDMQSFFTSCNCPAMRDKPKLFIGQFCRGVMEHTLNNGVMPWVPLRRDIVEENCTPAFADMYFLYATVPNFVAYRGMFVKILCEVFRTYADSTHIKDMATFVHNKMTQLNGQCLTISEERGTLRKDWYFNPPCLTHAALESGVHRGSSPSSQSVA